MARSVLTAVVMRSFNVLASVILAVSLGGCGKVVVDGAGSHADAGDGDVDLGPSKSRWSFELPSEGTPNDNGYVGPFCCTGDTAVVEADDGRELGYGYYFAWHGQAFSTEHGSYLPDVRILLAGMSALEADAGAATLEKGEIDFMASELVSGNSRSAQVGALLFTVTVEHADLKLGSSGVLARMGTLTVRLDVDPVD